MKATEQYFPVVQFVMLYDVLVTFSFVDQILKCVNLIYMQVGLFFLSG